jgi:hypothetical protein
MVRKVNGCPPPASGISSHSRERGQRTHMARTNDYRTAVPSIPERIGKVQDQLAVLAHHAAGKAFALDCSTWALAATHLRNAARLVWLASEALAGSEVTI